MNEDITTTEQETQEEFPKPAKKINYKLLGWSALILSFFGSYAITLIQPYGIPVAQIISPWFSALAVFIPLLVGVIILHLSTRILKIPTRTWSKALFSIGVSALAGIILTLITLPFEREPGFLSVLRSFIGIIILFAVLMRTYNIRVLKTLGLILVQFLVMIALAVVLALLFALLGFGIGSFIGNSF